MGLKFWDNEVKNINHNPYLLSKIQPVGGIAFNPSSIRKGDGYEACIHLYEYQTTVNTFWLEQLLNFDDVVVTVDVSTANKQDALEQINRSISENLTRIDEVANNIDKIEASNTVDNLTSLVYDITSKDEIIKIVTIRYFISARTIDELDKKAKIILERLEGLGYRGAIFLNEQEYEWKSLFLSSTGQSKLPNKRSEKGIPSISFGGGYPFHFTELNDPTGMYLGTTKTGGNVIFDLFTKDDIRKSYNALVIGLMGSGKSTLLKKILNNNGIVENTIRIFDIAGEFKTLVRILGGEVIALDGSDGIINPLQIFATIIDEDTNEILEEQSYMQHLSKVSMMYQFLAPNANSNEIREFEKSLSNFYSSFGIDTRKATQYETNEYPIMEELIEFLLNELYENVKKGILKANITNNRQERLENIILTLEGTVRDYGKLFNGHTTIKDITNKQIVSFEVRNLVQFDKRIFNAQTFNILTMLWNNALLQGLVEKKAFDEGRKTTMEAIKYLVLMDEAHKFINSNNIMAVDYLINFEREARKYFGGLIFATQSIRDVVPDNTSSEALEKIRTLFELTQYKFIMQQDNNSKKSLAEIFDGQLTESEIETVPFMGTGDCILSINGGKNIRFHIEASDKELELFKGGA
ncbi:ATP-binding protein [Clostridium botulinum]|nr:ATP-binding protein [Clostridium botulinum]NFI64776.1 ATP-binding protein [Clostridium botulinum]NFJ45634.1 ATP-binding protein [Clostridium botulinum]NFJ49239.1 ATP-binding protein [Clostridium botulinum]NFK26937.1 ATP-binding protein [Clostridium botulinum]